MFTGKNAQMTAIQPEAFQFLKAIADNNNRDWFQAHKAAYEAAYENFKEFVKGVETELGKSDHLESGKVFRIYRDVRFSKDKSPYKNNFAAGFKRATKLLRGGYYLHIEPGQTFVGGGFWGPEPGDLKRIRDEFAYDDQTIRKIIADPVFKSCFGNLEGDELKTAPKGYSADLPGIDLIRKKQFVVRRAFTDKEVTRPGFLEEVVKTFMAMRPFFDYMSMVLTTDANGEPIP